MLTFKRYSLIIVVSITICMLMVGCSKSVAPVNTAEKDSAHTPNDDSKQQDDLQSWAGLYKFSKYVPPDKNLWHRIFIYNENGEYYGDIYIDGFQTLTRIRTKVLGDEKSIKLAFHEYLPENIFEPFMEGDILLSFEKSDSVLIHFLGGNPTIDFGEC